jgi:hypothetical protein
MFEVARAELQELKGDKGGILDKRFSRQDAKRQSKISSFFRTWRASRPFGGVYLEVLRLRSGSTPPKDFRTCFAGSHLFADSVPQRLTENFKYLCLARLLKKD